jgi:hypothetical protein
MEVTIGGDRKSRFDYIHPKPVKLVRHANFFAGRHAAARRLFSIS